VRELNTGKNIVKDKDASNGFELTATHVAFRGTGGNLTVRDLATGEDIIKNKNASKNFKLTPTRIILLNSSGELTVCDLKTGKNIIKDKKVGSDFQSTATHVAFSDFNDKLTVYDLRTGKVVIRYRDASNGFQLADNHIAFRDFNCKLTVRNLKTGKVIIRGKDASNGFKLTATHVAFSDSGRNLTVRNLKTGKDVIRGEDASQGFELTPTHVAFRNFFDRLTVCNLKTGKDIVRNRDALEGYKITSTHVAFCGSGGNYTLCDLATGEDIIKNKDASRGNQLTTTHAMLINSRNKPIVYDLATGAKVKGLTCAPDLDESSAKVTFTSAKGGKVIVSTQEPLPVVETKTEEKGVSAIIDEYYYLKIAGKKGPGSLEIDLEKKASFYPIFEMLKTQSIEIYLPQGVYVSLTDAVGQEISRLNKRIRERTGNTKDAITIVPYNSSNLSKCLGRKDNGAKRVFINDLSMTQDFINITASDEGLNLLKGNRLITATIPQGKDDIENSVHQAWLMKVGMLGALLNENNVGTVGAALNEELDGRVDGSSKEYVNQLAKGETDSTNIADVRFRISYFLGKIVKLSNLVAEQLRTLKAFWTAA